ncbi:hypothetical protein [Mucilaginibacter sp. dw_454]|uniref:hypothetical protein n=1 Tax=Mucilaginibacter sp. dw_454 TaxID=2720079 RepID=UPI001BD3B09C|nr:hypothetical protein [Mucilaginibacter sp. dw_454]
MNDNQFGYIDRARDQDTAAVSYTYNGPETASSLPAAMTSLSATLSASTGAVEMWLYNNSQTYYHWIEGTPDNQYLFQVGLAGNTLNIDVFPAALPLAGTYELLPATGHYQVDISTLLPLYPFTHVVLQGNNLGAATSTPQIWVNGHQLTVSTAGTPAPFGFTIKANTGSVTLPDSIQSLKHLLLYNHLLSPATITTDANNIFFSASDLTYTGWYRFNVPAPGAPPTTINSATSDETSLIDTYPNQVMQTTYAYNATNQVTQQTSPDGGTNSYWYDLLSRLVFSQNDKQRPNSNWSYTSYDQLGRITEVGQQQNTTGTLGNPDYVSNATIATFNASGASRRTRDFADKDLP